MQYVQLTATNMQGAKVYSTGETKAQALARFDLMYSRKGWKIKLRVTNDAGDAYEEEIKKTYR